MARWEVPLSPRAWILGGLLSAFTLSAALTKVRSLDYWWHLRIGRWIAEHRRVPDVDFFSYTATGAPYLDVHWLHQLSLHATYWLGGHEAVVLWQGFFAGMLALLLWRTAGGRGRPEWAALLVAWAIWLASGRFMPRPELPTFVLLASVLLLLERDRLRGTSRALWWIIPLQWLWANTHGIYIVGIACCGIYLAGDLVEAILGRASYGRDSTLLRRRILRLSAVTVASFAVALLNPGGVDLLLYPWIQLGMISEASGLHAPWVVEIGRLSGSRADPGARVLVLLLAAVTAGALFLNRRRSPVSHVLLFGAFLYVMLGAHRNLALFAIVAAPLFLHGWNEWLDARGEPPLLRSVVTAAVVVLLCVGTVDGLHGRLQGRISDPRPFGLGVAEGLQPVAAVDWIDRQRPPGQVFHAMGDGGYLIWRLHPDYPVLLDGRLEVYGRDAFQRFNVGTPAAFRQVAAELAVGTALLNYRNNAYDALLRALHEDPAWTLAFVDDVAVVFVRADAGFAPLDVTGRDPFGPLPDQAASVLRPRVLTRVRFDFALGQYRRGLERWRAFRLEHPEELDEPLLHAGLLLGAGRSAEASGLLEQAVAAHNEDAAFLEQVASLRLQLGDEPGARAAMVRAVTLDPTLERSGGRPTPRAGDALLARRAWERRQVWLESAGVIALMALLLGALVHAQRPGRLA